jgi:hypothetical protein
MAIVEMPFLGAKIDFTHFGEAADFHLRAPLFLVKHDWMFTEHMLWNLILCRFHIDFMIH